MGINNISKMLWRKLNVGSEIAVYWKEYKGYFACSVIKKSGSTKNKPSSLFQVEYEDGTIEWTDMSKVKFRWQDLDDEEFDDDIEMEEEVVQRSVKSNKSRDESDDDDDDDDDDDEYNSDDYDKEEKDKISDVVDDDRSSNKRKTATSRTSSKKRMKKEEEGDKEEHTDIKKSVVPKTKPRRVASAIKSTKTEDNDKSGGDDSYDDAAMTDKDDATKDDVDDDDDDDDGYNEEASEEDDKEEAYDDDDSTNQKKQKPVSAKAKKVSEKKKKKINKDDDVQNLSGKSSKSPIEEVNPDSGEALTQEKKHDTASTKEDEDNANDNVGDGLEVEIKEKHGVARKDAKKAPIKKKSTKAMKELSDDKKISTNKRLSSKEVKKAHDNKELTKQNALLYIMVNHHMVGTTSLTFERIFKDLGFKPKNKAIEQAWKGVREKGLVEEANVSGGAKKHFQLTPEGIDFAASEDYKYQLANPPRTTKQLHEQIKTSANEYGVQIFDLLLKNGSMSADELADECGVSKNGHNFFYGFKQHKTFGYVIKDPNNKRANWILSPDKAFIN
jgi:hypothetical protein